MPLCDRVCVEVYVCRGSPNIQLHHDTTLELERESKVTPRGTCIFGVACRPLTGRCKPENGFAKLILYCFNPVEKKHAFYICHGFAPKERKGDRLIARKSYFEENSIIVGSNCVASRARRALGRCCSSAFSQCIAVIIYAVCKDTNPKNITSRSIVKNPHNISKCCTTETTLQNRIQCSSNQI